MSSAPKLRSLASAEASRRNGALSKGPRTALGKLKASQSSRKHGLFRSSLLLDASLPASADDLKDVVSSTSTGWLDGADQSQLVKVALVQLEEATRILREMRAELDGLLASRGLDREHLAELVAQIARMARYQRRFRGKRDRALRRLMATAAPPTP